MFHLTYLYTLFTCGFSYFFTLLVLTLLAAGSDIFKGLFCVLPFSIHLLLLLLFLEALGRREWY